MESLIRIIEENGFFINSVVLLSILLLQWDILLMDYLIEKGRINEGSAPGVDNLVAGMFFLLGLYAFFYHVIERAVLVYRIKGSLSITGKILFFSALAVYGFVIWLFLSLTVYLLIACFSGKKESS